jgi:hypothetical protein
VYPSRPIRSHFIYGFIFLKQVVVIQYAIAHNFSLEEPEISSPGPCK